MKTLSVILVSYNTIETARRSLEALMPQLAENDAEVVFVDNASSDGTAEMVARDFPSVTLLPLDKDYGYAYGANRGFERTSGRNLIVMSSDIVFPKGALKTLVARLASRPDVGVVSPTLVALDGTLQQITLQWKMGLMGECLNKLFSPTSVARRPYLRPIIRFLQRKERVVPWVSGAAFLIRREIFEKLRGFDEAFQLYFEDTDLFRRVRNEGWKILLTPAAQALHSLGGSTTKNEKTRIYLIYVQSHLYYYRKHLAGFPHRLMKAYVRWKFSRADGYRTDPAYRQWADHILAEGETIKLYEEMGI